MRNYVPPADQDNYMRRFSFNLTNPSDLFNLGFCFSVICLAILAPLSSTGAVLINEVMYHPNSTNVLEEWVELYNPGPTNVSLAGWKITKSLQFAFPTNTTITAGGFLVV